MRSGFFIRRGAATVLASGVMALAIGAGSAGAHTSPEVDANGCRIHHFCLYAFEGFAMTPGFQPRQFSTNNVAANTWINLSNFTFNDAAASMRNRRHGRSWLAQGTGGGGTRYCANPLTVDGSFSNNAIGNFQASSFYLSTVESPCP
jgi:hypothetical protein